MESRGNMNTRIQKNKSISATLRAMYIGRRDQVVQATLHISDVRMRIDKNKIINDMAFSDILVEIGRADHEVKRLRLIGDIIAETNGSLTTEEVIIEADKQLAHELEKQQQREKEFEDLKHLGSTGLGGHDVDMQAFEDLRRECGKVFRQIMTILHPDKMEYEESEDMKQTRETAYQARKALDIDLLRAILAGLEAQKPEAMILADLSDAEIKARIAVLDKQIEAVQKVLVQLMKEPMFHFSSAPEFLAARRAELEHQLRILQLEIGSLTKKLAA